MYAVDQLAALAKRKYEKTGVEYPKLGFTEDMMSGVGMTKTTERLTGLVGRAGRSFFRSRY